MKRLCKWVVVAGGRGAWVVAIISSLSLAMVSCRGPGTATATAETDGVLSIRGSYANNSLDVSHRNFKLTVLVRRSDSDVRFLLCSDKSYAEAEADPRSARWGFMVDYNGPLAVGPCPRWGGDNGYFDNDTPLWIEFSRDGAEFVIDEIDEVQKKMSAHFVFRVRGYARRAFGKTRPDTTPCSGKVSGSFRNVDYVIEKP